MGGAGPEALLLRFRAMADPGIRRQQVREALRELDPEAAAGLLMYLLSARDDPDARVSWLDAVIALLLDPAFGPARRSAIRSALPAGGVWGFLDDQGPGRQPGTPLPYDLEDVPLGVRKARARGRNRDDLRRIATDPDPSVIAILLENPAVTEAEVLRAASLRPQRRAVFETLLASPRFAQREAVLAALVLNPWCPVPIALALLPLLPATRLREVAESTRLPEPVREAAEGLGRLKD